MLYYKDKKLNEFHRWLIYTLAALRFILVSIVAFLLLSPLIKSTTKTTEKPIIVIAQDNSESIIQNKDSTFYKQEYKNNLNELIAGLNEKYDVKFHPFGNKIGTENQFDFNDKQTDISSVFNEIGNRYSGRNVGAILLASDGIYNKGYNPSYASFNIKAPVYTIAMGDTTIKKDAAIAKVVHNRFAYLGNKFPVQIEISAFRLKGFSGNLTLKKGDELLFSQKVDINNNNFNSTITLVLDAKNTGIQHYHIKLEALPDEVNLRNNKQDIFIDVRDGREKIALLANAPHPDIFAIKESLEKNQNYEVETYLADQFNQPLKKYGVVILHQIAASNKIINEIKNAGTPIWFIGTAPAVLNTGISIPPTDNKVNDVEAVMSKSFALFTISDELRNFIRNVPAVQCPFGNYKTGAAANVLLHQKIGIVETETPLFVFNPNGEQKTAVFIGDGLWKWKLRDFAEHNSHALFNELVNKTVQYLSTKADKSFFRVMHKNNFYENESIEFEAQVYNASYELINEPDVELIIINNEDKKFPFTFSKTGNTYRLNAGMLSSGQYKFESKVKVGTTQYMQRGEFSVTPLQIETVNTVADHQLLFNLAKKHGGNMVYPTELKKLGKMLGERNDIKTIAYTEQKLTDLINVKWLFFTLLGLLSLEWFIRKQFGAY